MKKSRQINKIQPIGCASVKEDKRVGSVVLSLAGHDKGSYLVIVAGIDDTSVLVADGKRRKLIAPKKKKMQHLSILTKLSDTDMETIRDGKANDSFLRKKIADAVPARFA